MGVRRHVSGNLCPTQGVLFKKGKIKRNKERSWASLEELQPLEVQGSWAGTEPSKFICLSASSQVSMSGMPVP